MSQKAPLSQEAPQLTGAPRLTARRVAVLALAPLVFALGVGAHAQTMDGTTMSHDAHGAGHGMATTAAADAPSTAGFIAANKKMHGAMALDYTGDVDVDFIRGMIPHHQGAIDMARVVLANSTDPDVRKLAEGIITAQEAEIAWMQDWLKARGY